MGNHKKVYRPDPRIGDRMQPFKKFTLTSLLEEDLETTVPAGFHPRNSGWAARDPNLLSEQGFPSRLGVRVRGGSSSLGSGYRKNGDRRYTGQESASGKSVGHRHDYCPSNASA